nr:UDP-N-acetylglucosamine pyrophosphorylase [Propionibacterium sp.]
MSTTPRGLAIVETLQAKGVHLPNPGSLDIADDVDPDRISGDGVTIHAGCRLRGARTVISAGCTLGAEGPVTLDDCQLGPGVDLKGGYFAKAVFLEGANLGLAAHVREGTILEEEAGGAHCVGLKQTILFPFVTLGSLINFCDCLMSGGTSRSDHSEVGSSYIHFNFTPDGNKTTASLFGDVPRGVMLDQPAIFLGGQGGAVGPVYTGFGTVVAAGSVLRSDVDDDGLLVIPDAPQPHTRPVAKHSYRQLPRLLERNLTYVASLDALDAWYRGVRRPFFAAQELGALVYEGALAALAGARAERLKRLKTLIGHVDDADPARAQLKERADAFLGGFGSPATEVPEALAAELAAALAAGRSYIAAIKQLSPDARAAGVAWLQGIIDGRTAAAAASVPALSLFTRA